MSLTPLRQRFVEEYLVDLNGTDAAIRAGYSAKSAKAQASQLLAIPEVQAAVSEAQASRSARTKIDADWVLNRLAEEADADVADLYDDTGTLKPVRDWPLIWRKGLVAGLDVEEVREEGAVVAVVRKVKLSDRIKRIELIGKHVGVQAFREQVGIGDPNGEPLKIETIRRVIVDPKHRDT
ncbi:Terminase small subunit [Bosea sp. 62]|uniref:terminase small subunit n=1 Tax=unclassified Bosea (in: a-proteobacteria) TaxID=2653178 RepID=UPI001254EA1D|nr:MULTISPECIES: terminase small subunit [unclassified Bosea (in: a-proteobacteria)]CAD5254284.1 Terminase small subunit [Bosea sp. 7B]CAD5276777.1 Terminase small subunit [Bosea sp. 21B]CAD5277929.1 Terminase small subunit [Bosea sp. 46]VVT59843.1 Terminase small subunit [Bosea sp. EC-HK365B]VXB45613.1 Terminase small subunit [Bosea sp. 62]